ncbi:MAG: hypothetical protein QOF53_1482 [Nocardioidaceae bacterium]|nr:hypothetical protein [Nocardioidaceae bacterium]
MIALLPLLGGVLLARLIAQRGIVIGIELALYALAAAVLITTAPNHNHSHGAGVLMSAALAALCVLAVVLGSLWRGRTPRALSQPGRSGKSDVHGPAVPGTGLGTECDDLRHEFLQIPRDQ